MKAFEKSVVDAGSGFDMNPSPGNIKDGLITDAMKSAGASKKGGTAPIVDVLDYANTNKFKTIRNLEGFDVNGSGGLVALTSGLYRSTSAITSIKLTPNAGNYAQYSHFALYGIKGAA